MFSSRGLYVDSTVSGHPGTPYQVPSHACAFQGQLKELSRRKWSPATTGPAGPSMADLVAIDGPAGPSMAATDGPLCRNLSPINFAINTSTGL